MKHLVIVLLSSTSLAAAPPSSPTPDADPDPPSQSGNQVFLELVKRHQATPEQLAALQKQPDLARSSPALLHHSFRCARAIKGDRYGAAEAYGILVAQLVGLGRYADATVVIEQIPHPRQLLIAADLLLATSAENPSIKPGETFDRGHVEKTIIGKHHFSLNFREQGELLVRLGHLASLEGREEDFANAVSQLKKLPTMEYLARLECAAAVGAAKRGEPYDFDALISPETAAEVATRAYPDHNRAIARAQFDIALIEYGRAEDDAGRERALGLVRRSLRTARSSRVFYGDLVVHICEVLSEQGNEKLAKELFVEHAGVIRHVSSEISLKPMLFAKLGPLFARWGDEHDEVMLLEKARELADGQNPNERAKSLAAIASGWMAVGEADRARELWSEATDLLEKLPRSNARLTSIVAVAAQAAGSDGAGQEVTDRLLALTP